MKSSFLRALLLAGVCTPASYAFSLYDTAPPIGLPESHAVRYSAYINAGYDDNLNSSSTNKRDGVFSQFGVRAAYSDQEAATKISYDVNLGARLYDKVAEGTDRQLFSESYLSASLSHSFSAASVYTTSLRVSCSTEPNFASSISAAYQQGEYLSWVWRHAYSRAIDARWSWTVDAAYTGSAYTRASYQEDDRQYLTGGLTLSYRYSTLTTYSVSSTFRHDMRRVGENSDNVYLNLGVQHSLSPISSLYATVGVQCKFVGDNTDLYPNLRFGYRRSIVEGLSANMYFSLDNENIDTGTSLRSMYLSNQAIRTGLRLEYALTRRVSVYGDTSVLFREYSKHTAGFADRNDTTYVVAAGMLYKFTEHLNGRLDYRHTTSDQVWGDYERNKITAGLEYTF